MLSYQTKVDKIRINTVMYSHEQINAKGKQRETEKGNVFIWFPPMRILDGNKFG